jgi:hypothetical protein
MLIHRCHSVAPGQYVSVSAVVSGRPSFLLKKCVQALLATCCAQHNRHAGD